MQSSNSGSSYFQVAIERPSEAATKLPTLNYQTPYSRETYMTVSSHRTARRLGLAFTVVILGVGPSLWTGIAHADWSSDVYADSKSVIEDLMTTEIAQTVVPRLACRAGRRTVSPGAKTPDDLIWRSGNADYELLALTFYRSTLQRIYSQEFAALRSSILSETEDLAGYLVLQALKQDEQTKIDKIGPQLLGVFSYNNGPDNEKSCESTVADRFESGKFSGASVPALDRECDGHMGPSCSIALAVRALLQNQQATAQDDLLRALSAALTDLMTQSLNAAYDQKIADAMTLTLREVVTGTGDFTTPVDNFEDVVVTTLHPKYPAVTKASVKTAWLSIDTAVKEIRQQWLLARTGGSFDFAAAMNATVATDSAILALCKNAGSTICKEIESANAHLARGRELWPLVLAASRGDVREVGHSAILLLFDHATESACAKPEAPQLEDAACDMEIYRRFAEAMVTYTIDVASNDASDTARAAFRSAATDVIRQTGKTGGFGRHRWYGPLVPSLNFRASWNPAYVNQSGSNLRYIASVDMLRLRIFLKYSDRVYSAIHLSFVDPLAPLSELAVRNTANVSDYKNQELLAWNIITPRLEFVIGIPNLSQHLAVGGGASLRLVVPFQTSASSSNGVTTYEYTYETLHNNFKENWPKFVEFGFFVKYFI